MATLILRWFLSRTVRQALDMCRQARKLLRAQQDLISASATQAVQESVLEVKKSVRTGQGNEAIRGSLANLEKAANQHLKPYPNASWRENVEVLLVTGAVVLALRSFFFQPMAIPSGSAQPTLWGITHENLKENPAIQIPDGLRRFAECCWAGIRYYHIVAKWEGELMKIDPPRQFLPFVKKQTFWVGNESYTVWFPPDQLFEGLNRSGIKPGVFFRQGEDILKLKVVSGDHLFVNRMTYNFRCPRRGEIIVFQSHGIPDLIPDTHYIKRLVAVGGDRVRIGNDRHLVINGRRLDASTPFFENVYGFDPKEPPRPDHYSGHVNNAVALKYKYMQNLAPLLQDESEEMVVRPKHFLAFGDNTMNSYDGRAWGDFPQEKVVGKASFVFWPFSSRFGWGYR